MHFGETFGDCVPTGMMVDVDALLPMIINAAAVGAGSIGLTAVALLARPAGLPRFSQALIGLLGILTVDAASSTFDMSPLFRLAPQWAGVSYVFWPWIPVLLWSYVDGLTAPGPGRVPKLRSHIFSSCLGMALYVPTLLLSGADKLALADGTLRAATLHHLVMALGLLGFVLLWIGQMLVSLHQIAKRLVAHRQRVRDLLSDVAAVDLRWIDGFGIFIGMGILLVVADNLGGIMFGRELLDNTTGALFEAAVIAGLVLFGLTQKSAVPDVDSEIERTQFQAVEGEPALVVAADPSASALRSDADAKYARSPLTFEDCHAIVARLDRVMTSQQLWRDPFLNLKMLSEQIATKPYYVTQALNTVLERNFYDYVNGWRARAAAVALRASDASVLSICEDVGFNSKSTFNSAFRKEIGVTPTVYRKSGT